VQVRGLAAAALGLGFVALYGTGTATAKCVVAALWATVLMRLAYLMVVNTFAVLGLLLAGDRKKDTEILVLRHQVAVLERQLGGKKVRFTPSDRVLLAALLHRLRRQALGRMRLLVRPDTVLRWHRDLIRSRHAARSRPCRVPELSHRC
jgi:putative transposase